MESEVGRIIWLDPNMSNNKMVPTEDLSIKVEFTAERKGRSIIYSGNETINTAGANTFVNFIEGSRINQSEQPSLTTRYTEAIALEVMNTQQQTDDFETLGIESIDIEFNTSFAPMIKIKFIDIRGNAILSQGSLSKYRMFFELPYPIFKLSVKGFYGKTVSYCLHMIRWNASFNSDTGNFEIQGEFIGYTYALLTDLLMGLVRASVRTKKGQVKLKEKQEEYGDNSNLIITIDDLILKLETLVNNLKKMNSNDATASNLQSYDDVYDSIAELDTEVRNLSNKIYNGTPSDTFFRSDNGEVLAVPTGDESRIELEINQYKQTIKSLAQIVNAKIPEPSLQLEENTLASIVTIKNITKRQIKSSTAVSHIINHSGGAYQNDDTSKDYIRLLIKDLNGLKNSSLPDDTPMNIYNLKRPSYHLQYKKTKISQKKQENTSEFNKKLTDEAQKVIGFKPSIRNIFRVLTVNSEIFLEVLKEVSEEAQLDKNGKRAKEFNKIVGKINVNDSEVINNTIYPWPEYRTQKGGENGYQETYLGAEPAVIPSNINEVVFTEELYNKLMDVARFDKDLENQAAGEEIDTNPIEVKYPWYPVSAIDTPLTPYMTENPYNEPVNSNKKDEVIRLLLMRGFLLLGVGAYNSKLPNVKNVSTGTASLTNLCGQLEAENFIDACRRLGPKGKDISRLMVPDATKKAEDYTKEVILNNGLVGSTLIENPPLALGKAKPIFGYTDENGNAVTLNDGNWANRNNNKGYYLYNYHVNTNVFNFNVNNKAPIDIPYLPVNKNFSGKYLYDGLNIKSPDKLFSTKGDNIFISPKQNDNISVFSFVTDTRPAQPRGKGTPYGPGFNNNDGSYSFKIIENNIYTSASMKPGFGVATLNNLKSTYTGTKLKASTVYDAILVNTNVENSTNVLENLEVGAGNYTWLEFDKINLDNGPDTSLNELKPNALQNGIQYSTLISFYVQPKVTIDNGTYLCNVLDDSERISQNGGSGPALGGIGMPCFEWGDSFVYAKGVKFTRPKTAQFEYRDKYRKLFIDKAYGRQKELVQYKVAANKNVYLPFIEFGIDDFNNTGDKLNLSLFGSMLYNQQYDNTVRDGVITSKAAKAILFLHCMPWQGVIGLNKLQDLTKYLGFDKNGDWTGSGADDIESKVLSIKSLFCVNSSFIHVPKAWALFIGGMLFRLRHGEQLIDSNNLPYLKDNIISYDDVLGIINGTPRNVDDILMDGRYPRANEYLYVSNASGSEENYWGMCLGNVSFNTVTGIGNTTNYMPLDKTLTFLPIEIQREFMYYFIRWVNDDATGFGYIQKELEIWEGYDRGFEQGKFKKYASLTKKIESFESQYGSSTRYYKISINDLKTYIPESVIKNYAAIALGTAGDNVKQINLVYKQNTPVMDNIVGLLTQPVILQNGAPSQWNHENLSSFTPAGVKRYTSIRADRDAYEDYLNGFYANLIVLNDAYQKEIIPNPEDELQQEIFGTTNDNEIRLMIYRTLSSINDKWLNGSKTKNVFVQCGNNNINKKDLKLAKKYRKSAESPSLIDTFRFVDRAFSDIGDKFFLNIEGIVDLIRFNYNQSLFDIVNKILSDNNFNFIPLPSFVNFNDITELRDMFTPYSYNNPVSFETSGPSFVCVYVGQTSVNLDLGVGSVYPDDGLSLTVDSFGTVELDEMTEDFKSVYVEENGDLMVPVFAVNYGQQNQNYFRSVKLDQREFAETMESLQVIESLSQGGDKSKPSYIGNNLFNVYKTRSYSAEVEMLGNAMVQPMMYFQLNNIPMFRGAYLIYKVNHSIKPNSMTTNFKGNRVKKAKTPLVEEATIYLNIVNSADNSSNSSTSSGTVSAGYYSRIVSTIIENGGVNGSILSGNITTKQIPKIDFIDNEKLNVVDENFLITEAVDPLVQMLNDWVVWMKSEGFAGRNGYYASITSVFRDYDKQVEIRKLYPDQSADPGESPHGWGIAIDIQFYTKDGKDNLSNTAGNDKGFSITENPSIKWLYDHSYEYGWISPYSLRDNSGLEEHWHFEYHGTCAKPLLLEHTNIYGYDVDTNGIVKPIVKNPKTPSGSEAVYTDCSAVYVKETVSDTSSYVGDGKKVKDQPLPSLNNGTMEFFKKLLGKLGAPVTDGNMFFLIAWSQCEVGDDSCSWNAFNTKQPYGGSTKCIFSGQNNGVQKFPNMDDGVGAIHKSIINGNYPNIIAALKNGLPDKQAAYDFAVEMQKVGKDLCIWKLGEIGCANAGGVPADRYLANILITGKMSGKNIPGSS